ncbi:hypothetical protein [Cytobacillus firmus]|uniref:Outer membrane lipoprotein-sorting protein n=1 Tax=Cytobacillus firmus DS1 TaxID=1307436 RepID=W7L9D4_CYTFI|nr:hypothetical protein [Cytobacillus firmus]EWG08419.1 outer membrane lipoprotein-sorting protein [Cytobacillus firmus DS1]
MEEIKKVIEDGFEEIIFDDEDKEILLDTIKRSRRRNIKQKTLIIFSSAAMIWLLLFSTANQIITYAIDQSAEKMELQLKMYNSVLYYETVQGQYQETDYLREQKEQVKFKISEGDTPGGTVQININDNIYIEEKSNGNKRIVYEDSPEGEIVSEDKRTIVDKFTQNLFEKWETLKDAFVIMNDGIPGYNYRERPSYIHYSSFITFPQAPAHYLRVLENWEIKEEGTLLGRKVKVIEGEFDKNSKEKFRSETFKMWVDTESGVLLKYISYDKDGKMTKEVHVNEIKFNEDLNAEDYLE